MAFQVSMQLKDLERALIAGGRPSEDKLGHRAADLLQRELLEGRCVAGESLGTLQEIRDRYGIGRWACREAIGILELRGLARPRRGTGGGLLAAAPSIHHLANLMLLHLCMKRALTDEIIVARRSIWRALVRKLVQTECAPRNMLEFPTGAPPSAPAGTAGATSFLRWLSDRAGNPRLTFLCNLVEAIYDGCEDFARVRTPGASGANLDKMQQVLWAAICRGNLSEAQDVLARYLALTETLPLGKRVTLPSLGRDFACVGSARSARRVAAGILDELVQMGGAEPVVLGSEFDITVRYDCNAEIVRQAVRLLEELGVVAPRTGGGGGLMSREPDLGGIVRLIPHLLLGDTCSPEDAREAIGLLKVELGACAARRVHQEGGEGGAAAAAKAICSASPDHSFDMITLERGLSELSGNSILVACELGLVVSTPPDIDEHLSSSDVAMESVVKSKRIAEAISRGDPAAAEQEVLNKYGWMLPDCNRARRAAA